MAEAPVVDIAALGERLGGDRSLLIEVLGEFLAQLEQLREPLASADPATVRTAAHTLTGMALTVGAASLASAARALGEAARAGAPLAAPQAEVAVQARAAVAVVVAAID